MERFRYRAMTQGGDLVSGSILAPDVGEVARRIEFLGLLPIEYLSDTEVTRKGAGASFDWSWTALTRKAPKAEEVTQFSRDLALVLRAGARIDTALDLLLSDEGTPRMTPVIRAIAGSVLAGESFAEALAHHPTLFSPIYLSLVEVGEASGTLPRVLESLADERKRSDAMHRKVVDAMRYPAFVLCAAGAVLLFFMGFVLPQFGSILREFGAKLDPTIGALLDLSDFMRANWQALLAGVGAVVLAFWLAQRSPASRAEMWRQFLRLPGIRGSARTYRTARFCRTLGVLIGNSVSVNASLRMLTVMMGDGGNRGSLMRAEERVRQGDRLSVALADTELPALVINMLRLGEETSQIAVLATYLAELYEAKHERSLEGIVAIIGPAAILMIAVLVGGMIVSIMTSLLSITQLVG